MRVLLVEDEAPLRETLAARLKRDGFAVDAAGDGEEGLYLGREVPFDVAIIDLGLPKLSGMDLVKQLREAGQRCPILILTARSSWQDKVLGLKNGADDYLVKPFHVEELLARLNALVRRASGWSRPLLECGPITLDTTAQTVSVNGQPVDLTSYEYKVLEYLMLHAGELVSKADLTEHIYQQDFDRDSNVLEVFIGRLRRKLDPDNAIKPIETVRGRGYRFALERTEHERRAGTARSRRKTIPPAAPDGHSERGPPAVPASAIPRGRELRACGVSRACVLRSRPRVLRRGRELAARSPAAIHLFVSRRRRSDARRLAAAARSRSRSALRSARAVGPLRRHRRREDHRREGQPVALAIGGRSRSAVQRAAPRGEVRFSGPVGTAEGDLFVLAQGVDWNAAGAKEAAASDVLRRRRRQRTSRAGRRLSAHARDLARCEPASCCCCCWSSCCAGASRRCARSSPISRASSAAARIIWPSTYPIELVGPDDEPQHLHRCRARSPQALPQHAVRPRAQPQDAARGHAQPARNRRGRREPALDRARAGRPHGRDRRLPALARGDVGPPDVRGAAAGRAVRRGDRAQPREGLCAQGRALRVRHRARRAFPRRSGRSARAPRQPARKRHSSGRGAACC